VKLVETEFVVVTKNDMFAAVDWGMSFLACRSVSLHNCSETLCDIYT